MIERGPVLNTLNAADLLGSVGIDNNYLVSLVRYGIIKPSRGGAGGKVRNWGPEEIFKAFVCKVKRDEYLEKHPTHRNLEGGLVVKSIGRSIPNLKFGGYREFVIRGDWKKITEKALRMGIDFSRTQYAFVPKKG
jgi:hypothetical protein